MGNVSVGVVELSSLLLLLLLRVLLISEQAILSLLSHSHLVADGEHARVGESLNPLVQIVFLLTNPILLVDNTAADADVDAEENQARENGKSERKIYISMFISYLHIMDLIGTYLKEIQASLDPPLPPRFPPGSPAIKTVGPSW